MTDRQCVLVVDDDPLVTEALAMTLECPGRTTVLCSDVDAAEICLERHPVTHLVLDVQFSGEFSFEGLHFIARVRAIAPKCRIVLITGAATDSLIRAAKSFGAHEVLAKPFEPDALQHALDGGDSASGAEPYEIVRFPSLEDLLNSDELLAAFQPIVRPTANGVAIFGFEALTRVRGTWLEGGPATLFEYAERRERLAELNLLVVPSAIDAAAGLPGEPAICINVDPLTFGERKLASTLFEASQRSRIALSRIVLEVTERSSFPDDEAALKTFDELRAYGVRFALDDHGSAYSHLSVINRIRPSFIKISNTFGTAFEEDETRTSIVRHIAALSRDLGCQTILEGIESAVTAGVATSIGIDLMQGYHFGRPSPASHWQTAPQVE